MPNPTRQDIIDAHDALAELRALVESNPPRHDTHAEKLESRIFAALPPIPRPTMAEVEWDDEKHYLAEAKHYICGNVIMLGPDHDGSIEFFVPKFHASRYDAARPYTLIPTGRRYTLTEAQE